MLNEEASVWQYEKATAYNMILQFMLQDMDTLDSEDISKFTAEEHNVISGIKNAHVAACYRKEDTRKSRQRFQRLFHFSQQNLCLIQLQTAREPLGNTNNMLRREC